MRCFGTFGPVYPDINYVVSRSEELADYINRVKQGHYIVLFAPRQTGKTTLFRNVLDALEAEGSSYLPIHLNFEGYVDTNVETFYPSLGREICRQIIHILEKRKENPSDNLLLFIENTRITDAISMREFFESLGVLLQNQRFTIIIDEFDGIPPDALRGFLHTLRQIYLSNTITKCPYSVGIVGVKNITQLNYDRSISPFNIQDEFRLSNFSLAQVEELYSQYTVETGQSFNSEVLDAVHTQTAGQPFLVNRFGQILTDELDIPKSETIQMHHFNKAYKKILKEQNTNISHLITNIRRDPRFGKLLQFVIYSDKRRRFVLDNEIISELAAYGIIKEDEFGMCQIHNPIYLQHILKLLQPSIKDLKE